MKKTILAFILIALAGAGAFAQGAYIEFKLTNTSGGMSGTSKAYSRDGNTRSEITMTSQQMPAGFNRVTLILRDSVKKAFVLNETAKTYSVIDLSTVSQMANDPGEFDITVIGKEKVNGYNCTHIKLKIKSSGSEEDVWLTAELPNFKQYMSVRSKFTSDGFFKALTAKGVAGFPVRMMVTEHGGSMQVDMVKAEMRNNPASLFSLSGYKNESAGISSGGGNATGSTGTPTDPQEMAKKIQNMTPEQRQEFLDQLRKQQQQQAPH